MKLQKLFCPCGDSLTSLGEVVGCLETASSTDSKLSYIFLASLWSVILASSSPQAGYENLPFHDPWPLLGSTGTPVTSPWPLTATHSLLREPEYIVLRTKENIKLSHESVKNTLLETPLGPQIGGMPRMHTYFQESLHRHRSFKRDQFPDSQLHKHSFLKLIYLIICSSS